MKYLMIISLTSTISSGATWFYLTKKMDPQFFKQLTTVAGFYLDKVKDPNAFCSPQQSPHEVSHENRGGQRGSASDGSVGSIIDEKAQLGELVKQAQEAHKERDRILKEMEESRNY